MPFAKTPTPPYYAVIFSSILNAKNDIYTQIADRMIELVEQKAFG